MGIASRLGARLSHVKAHGALYNQAERDAAVARTILMGIRAASGGSDLVVFAPPGSAMHREAEGMGMRVAREGFIAAPVNGPPMSAFGSKLRFNQLGATRTERQHEFCSRAFLS